MSPHVIDVNKCGGAVVWSQGVVSELVRGIVILGELVSRRDHCAQSAPPHCAGRAWENANSSSIEREMATTPMLFICDKGASRFEDLYLYRSRHEYSP